MALTKMLAQPEVIEPEPEGEAEAPKAPSGFTTSIRRVPGLRTVTQVRFYRRSPTRWIIRHARLTVLAVGILLVTLVGLRTVYFGDPSFGGDTTQWIAPIAWGAAVQITGVEIIKLGSALCGGRPQLGGGAMAGTSSEQGPGSQGPTTGGAIDHPATLRTATRPSLSATSSVKSTILKAAQRARVAVFVDGCF